MKRKLIFRCLLGAPIGLTITYLITIVISLIVADGNYYPVVPKLIEECGSEMNAALLQTACSLLYGAAWGGASVIWEAEKWSLMKMTLLHFIISSATTFPIAYFMYWMPHNPIGVLLYFGIFFAIYLIIWIWQFLVTKKRIEKMNRKLKEKT